jgi:hypothetical protein
MMNSQVIDVCTESPTPHLGWKVVNQSHLGFPYHHDRMLGVNHASAAIKVIDSKVKDFPFQIRYAMALPLWYRYADMYCATGDQDKAIGSI